MYKVFFFHFLFSCAIAKCIQLWRTCHASPMSREGCVLYTKWGRGIPDHYNLCQFY